ncbi:hypothetical protein AVEN_147994-1 [Araneus ventricosus]|uniref:Uncharacterized protein n=1 Tax=Araneus ventricosus TaxID=182803 RepID=A0A4Y2H8S3_ARAVE|nr:hypothetical protein AVEN_147994-1 [Araneus ventricosus]
MDDIAHFLGFSSSIRQENGKKEVFIFMDQCPAHPQDLPTFNNTKVVLSCELYEQESTFRSECHSLCESALQKTLIRRILLRQEQNVQRKTELKQVTVLDAIHMLCSSWRNSTEKCIKSCYKKAGFPFPSENECEEPESESVNCENVINGEVAYCTWWTRYMYFQGIR